MADKRKDTNEVVDSTKRRFIKNSGLTVGGLVLGGALGGLVSVNTGSKTNSEEVTGTPKADSNPNAALMFFTPDQHQITEAAAERIYPEDDLGPGAKDLDVAIYIDHQLASPWGGNDKAYMSGPFHKPEPTQGPQIKVLRKNLFLLGIKGLNDYSNKHYDSEFIELEGDDQDDILKEFESGKVNLHPGVTSDHFFTMLRTLTIEGAYADPMYGGNKDMQGWKMRKFPGSYMSLTEEIQKDSFVELEPQSLKDHMGH
ncbi:gluconate 2-dehydrogenase gamma chain [Virgibacillus halotolerans]|uniref:gluconate 2-dehydrogenase subunit 3 family protein n=1 Tax=Virgibacillus halotolerans TaxID=1071053 RepID=UPI00196178CA|nr:gluconate 2-dehydrogenase subunit 3 family protein [Virgibacillus halotolerans]MBM7600919.1 gluconate 2-dehydrogenase gamma chain [Virgibacillus halotolerans]